MQKTFLIAGTIMTLFVGGCARQPVTAPVVVTKIVREAPQFPAGTFERSEPCVVPYDYTNRELRQCYRANLTLIDATNERLAEARGVLLSLQGGDPLKDE